MSADAADDPVTWVVGANGLLGRAVVTQLRREGRRLVTAVVPWQDDEAALEALARTAASLEGPWRLVWAAGAGVVATGEAELEAEVAVFRRFLDGLDNVPQAVFLASSAGGLYAGSTGAPFDEHTQVAPLAPYGRAKLAMEDALVAYAAARGTRVALGRIANLYGPGQNIAKPQGLISQLCRAQLQRTPLPVYVSLDTARDYLYVGDAARMALAMLDRVARQPAGTATVKILGSGRAVTIAALIGELRRISRRRPLVVLAASPTAAHQVRDLRFRSVVWSDIDVHASTTLAAGVRSTLDDLASTLRGAVR